MTTIIYHDGWLFADGQATRSDIIVETECEKISEFADGTIIAFCGDMQKFQPFIEWYFDNSKPRPLLTEDNIGSKAIVLNNKGCWEFDQSGYSKINDAFCAWGSGAPLALAALHAGADPRKAMQIAIKLDIWSGGKVSAFRFTG